MDTIKTIISQSQNSDKILGMPIGVFSVVTPIIIFVAGYLLNRWNENRIEKRRLYDIRLYFYSQLDSLLKAVSKQKENIQEFVNTLREEKIQDFSMALAVNFQINHISDLSKTDLFCVIVSKEKKNRDERVSLFGKCLQSLSFIEWHSKNFQIRFDYVFSHCSDYSGHWSEAIENIGRYHDWLINDLVLNRREIDNDPFLKGFAQIHHDWIHEDNFRDMYIAEKKFIKPLSEHCKKMLPNKSALFLFQPLLKCQDAVDSHRKLRKNAIMEFDNYKNEMDNIYKDLENCLKTFRETQKY